MGMTRVDVQAVHAAAQRFEHAAEVLKDAVRSQFYGMRFDGSVAGKQHALSGDAVNSAVRELGSGLSRWSSAAAEIAAALREAAHSFTQSEQRIAFGVQ